MLAGYSLEEATRTAKAATIDGLYCVSFITTVEIQKKKKLSNKSSRNLKEKQEKISDKKRRRKKERLIMNLLETW